MTAVTTYARGKPFTWSYSKLKNFDVCPKRHWHIDIVKNVKEEESEILQWGNEVHDKLAKRLDKKKPLPATMQDFERHCAGIEKMPGQLYVEQKYGLTEDFSPCTFFDSKVWYRGIGDVVVVAPPRALAIDWKLGKVIDDSQQLALMAACIFGHYPEVDQVDTIFMWLKEDARTHQVFKRAEMPAMWNALMPRIKTYKYAVEHDIFPAKPGGLCKRWCPVDTCQYHGGGD
jgi:hypothetical protein